MATSGEHAASATLVVRGNTPFELVELDRLVGNMSGDERASFIKRLEAKIQSWKNGNFGGMVAG